MSYRPTTAQLAEANHLLAEHGVHVDVTAANSHEVAEGMLEDARQYVETGGFAGTWETADWSDLGLVFADCGPVFG